MKKNKYQSPYKGFNSTTMKVACPPGTERINPPIRGSIDED